MGTVIITTMKSLAKSIDSQKKTRLMLSRESNSAAKERHDGSGLFCKGA